MEKNVKLALESLEELEKGAMRQAMILDDREGGHWEAEEVQDHYSDVKLALEQAEKLDEFVKHYDSYRQRISNMSMANSRLVDNIEQLYNELDKAEKEHEALEIIKEKKVNVHFLIYSGCLKDYNYCWAQKLTKYEFDLLKEVLG